MSIDINSLSKRELATLISKAKKRKSSLAKRKPITAVRKKLTAQAKAEGYTIAELFGGKAGGTRTAAPRKPSKAAGKKVPPKYRDPANSANTWTGRGRQPRWLAAYTSAGRKVEEFLIKK